jgi:hypothetical protein
VAGVHRTQQKRRDGRNGQTQQASPTPSDATKRNGRNSRHPYQPETSAHTRCRHSWAAGHGPPLPRPVRHRNPARSTRRSRNGLLLAVPVHPHPHPTQRQLISDKAALNHSDHRVPSRCGVVRFGAGSWVQDGWDTLSILVPAPYSELFQQVSGCLNLSHLSKPYGTAGRASRTCGVPKVGHGGDLRRSRLPSLGDDRASCPYA